MNLRDDEGFTSNGRISLAHTDRKSPTLPVRVWLVINNPSALKACARSIDRASDIVCTACYSSAEEAFAAMRKLKPPDVLVQEIDPGDSAYVRSLASLRSCFPGTRVIVLAGCADVCSVSRAFLAGADGYLLKEGLLEEFIEGIRQVHRGGVGISPQVGRLMVDLLRNAPMQRLPECRLTSRERLHLRLLVRGLTKKEIAGALSISFHTVDTHLRSIYRKLKVNTRSAAVAKALQQQLC